MIGIETDFTRKKVASSYIQMIFIVCCFLLTAPNKEKIISVSHVTDGVFLSVYLDIMTCSQQKLKNFLFFICLGDDYTAPCFFMLV